MTRFLLGRTALFALGLVVASVLIFATLRLLPGDVAHVARAVEALLPQITAQQRALDEHVALHAAYCALVAETEARLQPLLDALDGLEEEIKWATPSRRGTNVS